MAELIDDKSQYCIPFILKRLKIHQTRHANDKNAPPFFLGLNGVQGAGKTVLVSTLESHLTQPPHNIPLTTLSLDDIYLTHSDQGALANSHPENPLIQHRGQPGTHDLELGKKVFQSLKGGKETRVPRYDKSLFGGEGDRVPVEEWGVVNSSSLSSNSNTGNSTDGTEEGKKIKLVIFEGWCVGFRALDDETLRSVWEDAVRRKNSPDSESGSGSGSFYNGRLGYARFEDVRFVNEALRAYDDLTDALDALIHIDAQDLHYVYEWRQEQERTLRAAKGSGMTEEQVNRFVDDYYPSYELFTQTLREGVFKPSSSKSRSPDSSSDQNWQGRQLRLVVDRNRRVKEVIKI